MHIIDLVQFSMSHQQNQFQQMQPHICVLCLVSILTQAQWQSMSKQSKISLSYETGRSE